MKKHPDEVFAGIVEYAKSQGYAIQTSSNIDLCSFDKEFMQEFTIEVPVYSYKGLSIKQE